MRKRGFVSVFVFLYFVGVIFPQHIYAFESERALTGKVVSNGKAVPFVAVYIKGSSTGTTTDENGYFTLINFPAESFELGVQGIGYKTSYYPVSLNHINHSIQIDLEPDVLLLEQVIVSGSRVGLLRYLPGSASIVNQQEILTTLPLSGNEIFRNIAGLHVVEEEGAGLRTNIGIRGLDPDKSRNVLILEDGIPVALAPYGEPEMYFTPNIDRMSGIEVLKGNGSILFGPQTIGGVINYLTADPPQNAEGKASFRAGDMGFYNLNVDMGNTINNTGFRVNFTRKQAENFGPTQFLFHDLNTKILTNFSPVSQLSIKLGVYDEASNSTYVGLTQPMFESGGLDDLRIAPDDNLNVRRYAISANHKYLIAEGLQLNTIVFGYTTTRNWNRQDFTYNSTASNLTGIMHGFENGTEGAIYLRNSTGQRNRQFEVAGFEPRLSYRYNLGTRTAKLDAGARYLYERAFEQRVNGTMAGVASGDLRDDEIRTGHAVSSYVQHKMMLNDKLSFTAGLRNENIWYEREIIRAAFKDTLIAAQSDVFSLIPGAGLNYNVSDHFGAFAGIHRGFAPPRTKDAISNSGTDLQLDAEKSWNYELGIRTTVAGINMEMTAFYMDFSNQVIPVSESSGGAGTGYINGGATVHKGIESSLIVPFRNLLPQGWDANILWNITWVQSQFSGDRYILQKSPRNSNFENVYVNVKGNRTPYAPDLTMATALVVQSPWGIGARFSGNYTGMQYTDALNTDNVYEWIELSNQDTDYRYVQATTNGRIGKLDPFFVANFSMWYEHNPTGIGVNLCVKNVFDERYIATRRPQGIRTGMPRFVSAGVYYNF
jgi:Fe(3+) dicitrate transport protein